MKRIISRITLVALIATTVAPTAQAGFSDLFKSDKTPIISGMLLALGACVGIAAPFSYKHEVQDRTNKLTTKNALDTIVQRLEQHKDNQVQVDVNEQLNALKEGFPVYRQQYSPPFIRHGINGTASWQEGHWVSVFDHYAISAQDIKDIRKACEYFNRNFDRHEQLGIIRAIHARLENEHIPTVEQLESSKKSSYGFGAACAGIGALGLLGSLYFKYAQNK